MRAHIQVYLDGEAEMNRAVVVAVHLAQCPACAREAEQLVMLKRALRRLRPLQSS